MSGRVTVQRALAQGRKQRPKVVLVMIVRESDRERFWAKVDKDGPVPPKHPELGPCWLWTAWKTKKGHGQFWIDGRLRPAHAVAQELTTGPLPEGADEWHHVCEVPPCVNTAHTAALTRAEHRAEHTKTHCPKGHEYSAENTYRNPTTGNPLCRECKRADHRRWFQERGKAQRAARKAAR